MLTPAGIFFVGIKGVVWVRATRLEDDLIQMSVTDLYIDQFGALSTAVPRFFFHNTGGALPRTHDNVRYVDFLDETHTFHDRTAPAAGQAAVQGPEGETPMEQQPPLPDETVAAQSTRERQPLGSRGLGNAIRLVGNAHGESEDGTMGPEEPQLFEKCADLEVRDGGTVTVDSGFGIDAAGSTDLDESFPCPLAAEVTRSRPSERRIPAAARDISNEQSQSSAGAREPLIVVAAGSGTVASPSSGPRYEFDELSQAVFASKEAAYDYVVELGRRKGFWVKKFGGHKRNSKGSICRAKFVCACHGYARCSEQSSTRLWGCPFKVTVLLKVVSDPCGGAAVEQWYISEDSTILRHCDHPFGPEIVTYMAGLRGLSLEVKDFIRSLREDKVLPAVAVKLTKRSFPKVEITRTLVSRLWALCDTENVVELRQLLASEDFKGELATDINGRISLGFWALREAKDNMNKFHTVILSDATYKTNRSRVSLILSSGVDNAGLTFLFAAGIMVHEDEASYEWMFEKLLKYGLEEFGVDFHAEVCAIVSDKDPAECKVIDKEKYFGPKRHILCLFHIFRNVERNLAGALGSDFRPFLGAFRETIFLKTREELESAIGDLYRRFPEAKPYLREHVFDRKEQFCYAFTKHVASLGNRTTGRAEVTNWLYKRRGRGGSSLPQLVRTSKFLWADYAEKRNELLARQACRRSLHADLLVRSLRDLVAPKIWKLIEKQIALAVEDPPVNVCWQTESGDWMCTCGFYESNLAVCRHIWAMKRQMVDIFCKDDLHPIYRDLEIYSERTRAEGPAGALCPVTLQPLQAGDVQTSDVKSYFARALEFANESAERRQSLASLLFAFVQGGVPAENAGELVVLPPARPKGRGPKEERVRHSGRKWRRVRKPGRRRSEDTGTVQPARKRRKTK